MKPWESQGYKAFRYDRMNHWEEVAALSPGYSKWAAYYHRRIEQICRFLVPPGRRVLEVGCGNGSLLAAVHPSIGVGIDLSNKMLEQAMERNPGQHYIQADGHQLPIEGEFDFILLSDLLNDVWDVQALLVEIRRLSNPKTRIIITSYNRLWEPALALANQLNLAKPNLYQNWLTVEDLANLLYLAEMEVIRTWPEILWPLNTPLLAPLCNKVLCRLWPFNHLALAHIVVARPTSAVQVLKDTSASIVIPARNEAGHIPLILERLPDFDCPIELIFIEGHSQDSTYKVIQESIGKQTKWSCKLVQQSGEGKGDAVREGFNLATGDILMILDADLTVPPEDLPRFLDALISGKAEFANGVRLVYPMQQEAMRFFNLIGNKFFSLAFSWLLGQPIKDTLCGTKAIWRDDYKLIAQDREYFGKIDPFGDFDLLLGAAKLNLKIVDIPIRYHSRSYGSTNISRWRHGLLLFRMMLRAARKIKFI
jgi:ubiquinone/menaquinone biosynthesis C-methylase UbiE